MFNVVVFGKVGVLFWLDRYFVRLRSTGQDCCHETGTWLLHEGIGNCVPDHCVFR